MMDEIKKIVEVLQAGGIILYPTDTVWGIGCDATNAEAVQKIYQLKQRSDSKSMLLLTDSMAKVQAYVADVPDVVWDLVECADKPLTIIYPEGRNVATNLLASDGSIGIRITNEAFSKQLCMRFKKPIVSTSANISGEPTPAFFAEISDAIKNGVDYVVQARQDDNEKKSPSSIIKFEKNGTFVLLRP
ncbi:MAG: L-threonylcarbamoyladenylate synthase [Paludibacteraceae bacterium]|nr:L-threonylcarbamoyladenylate synthase [Paludibacteraceae bacterium]